MGRRFIYIVKNVPSQKHLCLSCVILLNKLTKFQSNDQREAWCFKWQFVNNKNLRTPTKPKMTVNENLRVINAETDTLCQS